MTQSTTKAKLHLQLVKYTIQIEMEAKNTTAWLPMLKLKNNCTCMQEVRHATACCHPYRTQSKTQFVYDQDIQ